MRNPNRIPEIIATLQLGWQKVSDWRLGQLFENLKRYTGKDDLFHIEDEAMIRYIIDYFDLDKEGKK